MLSINLQLSICTVPLAHRAPPGLPLGLLPLTKTILFNVTVTPGFIINILARLDPSKALPLPFMVNDLLITIPFINAESPST